VGAAFQRHADGRLRRARGDRHASGPGARRRAIARGETQVGSEGNPEPAGVRGLSTRCRGLAVDDGRGSPEPPSCHRSLRAGCGPRPSLHGGVGQPQPGLFVPLRDRHSHADRGRAGTVGRGAGAGDGPRAPGRPSGARLLLHHGRQGFGSSASRDGTGAPPVSGQRGHRHLARDYPSIPWTMGSVAG
jgi:hypothetical protein